MTRKNKFVVFRDEEQIIQLVDQVVIDRGIDRSDFIREAIRKKLIEYYPNRTSKAVGIEIKKGDVL